MGLGLVLHAIPVANVTVKTWNLFLAIGTSSICTEYPLLLSPDPKNFQDSTLLISCLLEKLGFAMQSLPTPKTTYKDSPSNGLAWNSKLLSFVRSNQLSLITRVINSLLQNSFTNYCRPRRVRRFPYLYRLPSLLRLELHNDHFT